MEKKINIAELLKDCPKGTKLYSPLCGECELYDITNYSIKIKISDNDTLIDLFHDGTFCSNGECMLYPSKGKTTWEGFAPPCKFKDGDVCYIKTEEFEHIFIFKVSKDYNYILNYANLSEKHLYTDKSPVCTTDCVKEIRYATEEEKQKLFQAIKDNGYEWNAETKTLEKLPKFKVGDKITDRNKFIYRITEITDKGYKLHDLKTTFITFEEADLYFVKVVDVFDITNLKPFDWVLVRDRNDEKWGINLFGYYNKSENQYYCIGFNDIGWDKCIPYEANKELLGTTNDCDDFYKIWK